MSRTFFIVAVHSAGQYTATSPRAGKDAGHRGTRTNTVYVHSTRSDFAETQILSEAAYLGHKVCPATLKFLSCGCGAPRLMRIARSSWMRFLPGFRHYRCLACGKRVFRARTRQRGLYGAVYLEPDFTRLVSVTGSHEPVHALMPGAGWAWNGEKP